MNKCVRKIRPIRTVQTEESARLVVHCALELLLNVLGKRGVRFANKLLNLRNVCIRSGRGGGGEERMMKKAREKQKRKR